MDTHDHECAAHLHANTYADCHGNIDADLNVHTIAHSSGKADGNAH